MAQLDIFTATQSAWRQTGDALEIDVGFALWELDTTLTPAALMTTARDMLPPFGTYFESSDPVASAARLTTVQFSGNSVDALYGVMTYTTATGLEPSTLLITVDGSTVQVETDMGPEGEPIGASYASELFPSKVYVPFDRIQHVARVPCSRVIVDSMNYGTPSNAREQYIGRLVGDEYRGRRAGSWMVDSFTTVYSVYRGQTSSRLSLLGAPGGKVWWLKGTLKDTQTGKYVYYPGMKDDIKDALDTAYSRGEKAPVGRGFSVYGWYETVALSDLALPAAAL